MRSATSSPPRRRISCCPIRSRAVPCSSTSRRRPTTSRRSTRGLSASRHVLTFGGNARRNNFDITLAPLAENRTELGAYVEDEIFLDRFRLSLGARVDKFGNLSDPVFSPRLSATFKPTRAHAIRAGFNRAFRSPSVINNYLDLTIVTPIDLAAARADAVSALRESGRQRDPDRRRRPRKSCARRSSTRTRSPTSARFAIERRSRRRSTSTISTTTSISSSCRARSIRTRRRIRRPGGHCRPRC